MNFQLTEEQSLIREMVRSFAETEVARVLRNAMKKNVLIVS